MYERVGTRDGDKHRKCVLDGECRPSHNSSKSTSRWCRGRAGIPHTWEWLRDETLPNASAHRGRYDNRPNVVHETQVCFDCGKHGGYRSYCGQCGEPEGFTVVVERPYTWSFRKWRSSHLVTQHCKTRDYYCRHCYAPKYGTQRPHPKAKQAA